MAQFRFEEPSFLRDIPTGVKNLLIINVLAFVGSLIALQSGMDISNQFGVYYFDSPYFHIYQIFTSIFLHANFMHLLFNMFGLFIFGSLIENYWGTKRLIFYYLITGMGASIFMMFVNAIQLQYYIGAFTVDNIETLRVPAEYARNVGFIYLGNSIGASGAVFGLMAAFAFMFPNLKMQMLFFPVPIKAKYFVLGYAAIELVLGLRNNPTDNIAHFAHIGGAVVGLILLLIFKQQGKLFNK